MLGGSNDAKCREAHQVSPGRALGACQSARRSVSPPCEGGLVVHSSESGFLPYVKAELGAVETHISKLCLDIRSFATTSKKPRGQIEVRI